MTNRLTHTTTLGRRTRHRGVTATDGGTPPWLEDFPVCPALAEHHIIHLGVVEAVKPYRFVRPDMIATTFLACLAGEGRVLVDGEWERCVAGTAVLLPSHTATAYYAVSTEPWVLVWVCYQRPDGRSAVGTVSSPALAKFQAQPIFHAVEGLREECRAGQDPVGQRPWVNLVHSLVQRYAAPWRREDPLHRIWEKVAGDLGADWTLDRLAAEARCSGEQLRRLCHRQLGRSPIQHVTHLRLQHATRQLLRTNQKVEYIAAQVGYDPATFSAMFKKWIGTPPSEYRQRRAGSVG